MLVTLLILAGSAIAITLLVLLNTKLGGWTPARIESLEMAMATLQDDHLGFVPGDGVLSTDGLAALVMTNTDDAVGLVAARGAGFVTRLIRPSDKFRSLEATDAGTLTLALKDDTMKPVVLTFDTAQEASDWAARVNKRGAEHGY